MTSLCYNDTRSSLAESIDRLHPLPAPTRPYKESNIPCMDCGTPIRVDYAAGGGSASGQLEFDMGVPETIYEWGSADCGCLSVGIGLDGGDSAHVCDGAGDGW